MIDDGLDGLAFMDERPLPDVPAARRSQVPQRGAGSAAPGSLYPPAHLQLAAQRWPGWRTYPLREVQTGERTPNSKLDKHCN